MSVFLIWVGLDAFLVCCLFDLFGSFALGGFVCLRVVCLLLLVVRFAYYLFGDLLFCCCFILYLMVYCGMVCFLLLL